MKKAFTLIEVNLAIMVMASLASFRSMPLAFEKSVRAARTSLPPPMPTP